MNKRPKLEEILSEGVEEFKQRWDQTKPADESKPIPAGEYRALVADGELAKSRNGTPSYKLSFEILEPEEFYGRKVFHDLWLTPKALSIALRDLARIGIRSAMQLEDPLPVGMIVSLKVALEMSDKGNEYNKVLSFKISTNGTPASRPRALDPPRSNDAPTEDDSDAPNPTEGEDIPF
jgi:hypothetical protein